MEAFSAVRVGVVQRTFLFSEVIAQYAAFMVQFVCAFLFGKLNLTADFFLEGVFFFFEIFLHSGNFFTQIRQDEEVDFRVGCFGHVLPAFFCHLNRMLLLVECVVKRIIDIRHVLGILLKIEELGTLAQPLNARLGKEFDQTLVFAVPTVGTQQGKARF